MQQPPLTGLPAAQRLQQSEPAIMLATQRQLLTKTLPYIPPDDETNSHA